MTLVNIKNVTKAYNEDDPENRILAVKDASIRIEKGEFISVIGPTGCGKSTLMDIVGGLIPATEGQVQITGERVTGPRPDVGMVFQDDSTLPWRTALENTEFGLEMRGVDKKSRRKTCREFLDLVGISKFEDSYPSELSGGMRQRVVIARTLALNPDIMLMDEPFGALDEQTRLILGQELLRICRETKQTTMFITHSLNEAALLSDRVVVMTAQPGKVKEIIDIEIPRPRGEDVVLTDEYNEYTDKLWHLLQEESKRSMEQMQS